MFEWFHELFKNEWLNNYFDILWIFCFSLKIKFGIFSYVRFILYRFYFKNILISLIPFRMKFQNLLGNKEIEIII